MPEKRIYQRFNVQLSARYKLLNSPSAPFGVTVVNVGAEGLCFLSKDLFDIGQIIELHVHLNCEGEVFFKTEVIWLARVNKETYNVGVKIVEATMDNEKRFIKFYCEELLSLSESYKKILVIDHEKDFVKLLQMELEQENYHVVYAYDGQEGFAKYLNEQPHLIILDLALPKLNGHEVCRKIRREKQDHQTPILMLTATKNEVDRIIGSVIGAQRYMTKPFKIEDLLHEVGVLLQPVKK